MAPDIKEVVGILMRILAGGEITLDEVEDLDFDSDPALAPVINETYIKLLEFVHDREARQGDAEADRAARAGLQVCLDRIVTICEQAERESR
jgi:hypothetical protein